MAKVSTSKKIVAILHLFLLHIILPTVDVGTDAMLISKLYTTNYVCIDDKYETCHKNKELNCQDNGNPACQLENGTYSCNHTGTYEICFEDPKLFCTSSSYKDGISCCDGFHPVYASSLLFIFLFNYLISWITWARLTEVSRRRSTFIFPSLNCFPQFGKFTIPTGYKSQNKTCLHYFLIL